MILLAMVTRVLPLGEIQERVLFRSPNRAAVRGTWRKIQKRHPAEGLAAAMAPATPGESTRGALTGRPQETALTHGSAALERGEIGAELLLGARARDH